MRLLITSLLVLTACGDAQPAAEFQPIVPDSGAIDARGDTVAEADLGEDTDPADAIPDAPTDVPEDTTAEDTTAEDTTDADITDAEVDVSDAPEDVGPEPLQAEPETWTWVPIEGTKCADGSPTGLGLNLKPGATQLFIYLEGGGACWTWDNCFGLVSTALHLDGFDERTFDSLITDVYLNSLTFDREDPKNPLRDAHFVFLPYCTADIFAGDAERELEGPFNQRRTIHFHGKRNMEAYLQRLAPTFPDVDHVVVAGSSAGGFGAAVSWPAVKAAFPGIRVDVIDDSGPPVDPAEGRWAEWIDVWGLTMPPDCPECGESVRALRNYYRRFLDDQGSRIAFISYARDTVIATFMGILPIVFEERINALCDEFGDEPQAQCFIIRGRLHTLLIAGTENESGGLPLWRWLEQMLDGDEEWTNAMP